MGLSWLVVVGAATTVGLVAVRFAGAGLSGPSGPSTISVALSAGAPDGLGGTSGGSRASSAVPGPSSPTTQPEASGPAGQGSAPPPGGLSGTPRQTDRTQGGSPSSTAQQPTQTASSSGGSSGSTSSRVTEGGTVVADCAPGWPRLLTWSPAPEWSAGPAQQGSASNQVASVTFRHDKNVETVSVTCRAGNPNFVVSSSSGSADG